MWCAIQSTQLPYPESKERMSVLDVLRHGQKRLHRLNAEGIGYLGRGEMVKERLAHP